MGAKKGFSTRAIHSGQRPDPKTGGVITPINLSTTFQFDSINKSRGYEYIRTNNPTREALETCFADLEGADYASAFASGIAAVDSVLRLLKPGDEVILCGVVYGGTIKLLRNIYAEIGVEHQILEANLEKAITPKTKMILAESPANPYMNIVDLAAVAQAAKTASKSAGTQIITVVDGTIASPYLQNPLELGIDIVLHSATKYLGGHSDVLGGLVATNSAELAEHIKAVQSGAGAVLSPFDSYMVMRGMKTLGVRMEQICKNAMHIAETLEANKNVLSVSYPGLKSHPGHKVAAKQMRGFGGMLSFCVEDEVWAKQLVENLELIILGESLGGVESLISHPTNMSHHVLIGTEWEIPANMLRMSVGLEDKEDLVADLEQALARFS